MNEDPALPAATAGIVRRGRAVRYERLPGDVRMLGRQCLLDWIGVTIAGSREPTSEILRRVLEEEGGRPAATLIGTGKRAPLMQAALVNGTAAHVLDYDDVSPPMSGHPSAPIYGALLPAAEVADATGRDLIAAFVAGVETASRVGRLTRPGHYASGWHATGTHGTFGAAAAVASLRDLDQQQWETALGLAGAQAAGLKSMFGTMAKPFHAGRAAANGLLAATLAERGFTADRQVLDSRNGYAHTVTSTRNPQSALELGADNFDLRTVLFKFHASCYATHSPIEGALRLVVEHGLSVDDVVGVTLEVPEAILETADQVSPSTTMGAKFSIRFATALALAGRPTDEAGFVDANLADAELVALQKRIEVIADPDLVRPFCSRVTVRTRDGASFRAAVDVSLPTPTESVDGQWDRLAAKFEGLVAPLCGSTRAARIIAAVAAVEETSVRDLVGVVERLRDDGRYTGS